MFGHLRHTCMSTHDRPNTCVVLRRAARIHFLIMGHLRKQMPYFGQKKAQVGGWPGLGELPVCCWLHSRVDLLVVGYAPACTAPDT